MFFQAKTLLKVLCHSIAIPLFIVSLLSGIRLSTDSPIQVGWISQLPFIPQGDVFTIHQYSAYIWLTLFAIVIITWFFRIKKKNYPRKKTPIKDLTLPILYNLLAIQILSGLFIYISFFPKVSLPLHYLSAIATALLVIYHSLQQLIFYRAKFLSLILVPKRNSKRALLTLTSALFIGLILIAVDLFTHRTLFVKSIPKSVSIDIDGIFNEEEWRTAKPQFVSVNQGNSYFEDIDIEVRALHNGLVAYFAIRWPDPTQNFEHLPLIKTESGWQAKHDGFDIDDERTYYEDKFAVMLAEKSSIGGSSTYLGSKPLDNYPSSRSGRGYHYTTDNSIRDIWHWKATRVSEMSVLDDDHFGPPNPSCQFCLRYKAGYHADPQETGSVRNNWTWFYSKGVTPLRLPLYTEDKTKIASGQYNSSAIPWRRTKPYSSEEDNFPIGTILPSILLGEIYNGDRGDVRAKGRWQDGYWHLELARALNTHSKYDIALQSGIYIWFAPFDHAQTRHAYHLKPLKLSFEQLKLDISIHTSKFASAQKYGEEFNPQHWRKLDRTGKPLAAKEGPWSCVMDLKSGNVWEVKSWHEGKHYYKSSYSWTFGNTNSNKKLGSCQQGFDLYSCNTNDLVIAANDVKLCGLDTWRLPTESELKTLIYRDVYPGKAQTNPYLFPRTYIAPYWTNETLPVSEGDKTTQKIKSVHFLTGDTSLLSTEHVAMARLVAEAYSTTKQH